MQNKIKQSKLYHNLFFLNKFQRELLDEIKFEKIEFKLILN